MSTEDPNTRINTPFTDYLHEQLARKGWTVDQCAAEADLPRSVIYRWVDHGFVPNIGNARKLAGALGVPMMQVMIATGQITADEAHQADAEVSHK